MTRVLGMGAPQDFAFEGTTEGDPPLTCVPWLPVGMGPYPIPTYRITLRLDAPPREILALDYRAVRIEVAYRGPVSPADRCPHVEWLQDEVDLITTARGTDFRHSILLTNGCELRLTFADFDFDFAVAEPAAPHPRAVGA